MTLKSGSIRGEADMNGGQDELSQRDPEVLWKICAGKARRNPKSSFKFNDDLRSYHQRIESGHFGLDTVDGQNPAPPRMMIIPLFRGF